MSRLGRAAVCLVVRSIIFIVLSSGRVARFSFASIHHSVEHDDATCVSGHVRACDSVSAIGLLALRLPVARAGACRSPVASSCAVGGPDRHRLRNRCERDPARGAVGRDGRPLQGLGFMEQYEYRRGRRGLPRSPPPRARLDPGAINLAIALLERQRRQGRAGQESRR